MKLEYLKSPLGILDYGLNLHVRGNPFLITVLKKGTLNTPLVKNLLFLENEIELRNHVV